MAQQNLTLIYSPKGQDQLDSVEFFSRELLQIEIFEPVPSKEDIIEEALSELDNVTKSELKQALVEVEEAKVAVVDDDYYVKVNLKDESLYAYAPHRFALAEKKEIRKITDELLARGIIKQSVSPYCVRIVPIRKKTGELRICVDLRPLNSRVIKQKYPFLLIEDCLTHLASKSIFTLLDLKDGFHQIKVHPEHTKYFAFATPDGQYEYTRLPFAFCEAPAEFQKRVVQILQPLIRQDKVIVYIDDILIPSDTIAQNLLVLKEVLIILKQYNLELNFKKCHFLRKSIEYLGYVISADGLTMSPRHTQAVSNFPYPRNTHEVQRFLGLRNYFRKFIKDYARKAKPLYNLLKKSVDFVFDSACIEALNTLKAELTAYPVLRLYSPNAEIELHTDASAQGLGAVLLQKQHKGAWAPVAYFSQATNQAEAKYHSFELEMLAIVRSVERFHVYLYGIEFTMVTDCNALVHAVNKANLNPRIARWTLLLQNYKFKMAHRPGTRMAHVDALSRQIAFVEAIERELQIRQLQDPRIEQVSKELEFNDNDKFELIDGLVYRKGTDRPRFVVPDAMISNIICIHHDEMVHCGIEKTLQGIYKTY